MLILFFLAVILLLYPLTVYPVLIALLARLFPKPVRKGTRTSDSLLPTVSFIIPAYNEEAVILGKVQNTLSLDYPAECIQIIVASDGSSDQTVALAGSVSDPRLKILDFSERRGKLAILDDAVRVSQGELIVFSDASALLEPMALRNAVMNFEDPTVGCVSGRYLIQDKTTPLVDGRSVGERGYFEFEVLQRRFESMFYSTLGAHGAFYLLRKGLYPERPPGIINDDFVIPMLILAKGYRTIYEENAVVVERHQTNVRGEYNRRVRISRGNFQQILILKSLLSFSVPRVAFVFWSHKVIRSFQPLYLALIFMIPPVLGGQLFWSFFLLQVSFYTMGIFGLLRKHPAKILAVPLYFTLGNTAIVAGFLQLVRQKNRQVLQWEKS